jgi:hypothetical protein
MKIIVPLAGPDYFKAVFAKGLCQTDDGPLLLATLKSRPWFAVTPTSNYSFVLLDSELSRAFAANHLSLWFPGCRITLLSQPTQGAALSALAGVAAAANDTQEAITVDLADISFETDQLPFAPNTPVDACAIGYAFASNLDCYSYYELAEDRLTVISAVEKKVISSTASCGVYAFRSASLYLEALSHVLLAPGQYTHNGLFYVCPLFNGLVKRGHRAIVEMVQGVKDVKAT